MTEVIRQRLPFRPGDFRPVQPINYAPWRPHRLQRMQEDPTIVASLVQAHRTRTLVPGGTLDTAIPLLRLQLDRALDHLRRATSWGNRLAAALGLSRLAEPASEPSGPPFGSTETALAANSDYRCVLAKDIARMRWHLAELETARRAARLLDESEQDGRSVGGLGADDGGLVNDAETLAIVRRVGKRLFGEDYEP